MTSPQGPGEPAEKTGEGTGEGAPPEPKPKSAAPPAAAPAQDIDEAAAHGRGSNSLVRHIGTSMSG